MSCGVGMSAESQVHAIAIHAVAAVAAVDAIRDGQTVYTESVKNQTLPCMTAGKQGPRKFDHYKAIAICGDRRRHYGCC